MKTPMVMIMLLSLILSSCGADSSKEFHPLTEQQPTVMVVEPSDGSILENPATFSLQFSQRLDIRSITPLSVTLIHNDWRNEFAEDAKNLLDSLEGQELETVPLNYELEGDEKTLRLIPQIPLQKGRYHLAVTPRLLSATGIPFNQVPGATPQAWSASFGVGANPQDLPNSDSTTYHYGPSPQLLVINEILYDGKVSETDGESFIELLGTPGGDISGYEIFLFNGADGETTKRISLPDGSLLDAEGIFVIADLNTNSTNETKVLPFDLLIQFDPQNGPDAVHLKNRDGKLLDALCYGEGSIASTPDGLPLCEGQPAPDVTAGHSLSRQNGGDSQNNQLDFFEKEIPNPGTP